MDRFHIPVPFWEGSKLHFSAPRLAILSVNDQSTKISCISRSQLHPCVPVVSADRTNIYKVCVLVNEDLMLLRYRRNVINT